MLKIRMTIGLVGACLVAGAWFGVAAQQPPEPKQPTVTLGEIASGKAQIVDLTHALNSENPYWPAANYEPFRLKTIATLEKNGVLSKAFSCPEHLGTHLDAPNHFEKDRPSVAEIPPAHFFAPAVVIDISLKGAQDADAVLSVQDISDWERQHGRIPDEAVVLLRTGWGQYWNNFARYKNQDALGKLHFPSYSGDAARFLVNERKARGLGIDNLSIDSGISKDFAVHHIVNAAGRYGLENVAQLDKLPPRGFWLVVAPIKIDTGTGGPTRIFAIVPSNVK